MIEIVDLTAGPEHVCNGSVECDRHRADRLIQTFRTMTVEQQDGTVRDLYLKLLEGVRLLDESNRLLDTYRVCTSVLVRRAENEISIPYSEIVELAGTLTINHDVDPNGVVLSFKTSSAPEPKKQGS